MQSVCVFFHISRKFEFLVSQGSVVDERQSIDNAVHCPHCTLQLLHGVQSVVLYAS